MSGLVRLSLRLTLGTTLALGLALPLVLSGRPTVPPRDAQTRVRPTAAQLSPPLAFEPNAGRYGRGLRFLARRGGYALGLMGDGSAVLASGRTAVSTALVGARPHPLIHVESRLPGTVNSYVGRDQTRWRTGIRTYGAIRYEGVYPGIDLRYHGGQGQLEYDYILRPGADPGRIATVMRGAGAPELTRGGDLTIDTASGKLQQRRPVAYQVIGGRRSPVNARFQLDGRKVRIRVGSYDERHTLVIDPQLIFTTYLGGTATDSATSANVITSNGGTYVLVGGTTRSPSFHGSNQNADPALVSSDAWISKLSADGSTVLSTTFIGGTNNESLTGLTSGNGHVFVTGGTNSSDLPTSVSLVAPYDATYNAGDSWMGRLDPTDLSLEVVTYFAGSSSAGIAYRNFAVVVAGSEATAGLATAGAYDTTPTATDAYAASFNASLTQRNWATYLGGSLDDNALAVTVDANANVYLTGYTAGSPDFPVTVGSGAAQLTDAFLAKLTPNGQTLSFSRLYGGPGYEVAQAVWTSGAVAVIGGWSDSDNLPGIGPSSPAPGTDGWVTMMSTSSSTTFGGAFLGGTGTNEAVSALGVDPNGGPIYAVGMTDSTNFPTLNALQANNAGGTDAFVTKLVSSLGSLQVMSSTYLGGTGNDSAAAVAVAAPFGATAYVVGQTSSTNFGATATYSANATPSPAQPANAGGTDAFVARIQPLSAKITGGPAEGSTVGSATANFTLAPTSEGGTFSCKLDGAAYASCTSTPSYSSLADGAHVLSVTYAEPIGGNTDGSVAVRHWTVDTAPPASFNLQTPSNNAFVASKPAFAWDATTDSASAVTYELWVDGAKRDESPACKNGSCSVTAAAATPDGAHTWQVRALDAVGNVRSSAIRNFTVDAAGPTAAALAAPGENAQIATASPELSWAASSDPGIGLAEYDVELDGRTLDLHLSPATLSYTPSTALAEGAHDWQVIARDAFGNETKSSPGHFRIDLTPPSAQLTVSPNPALAGRTVTLDASSSNDPAGGHITRYEWDLDGDGTFEQDGGTTPTLTRTFNASGSYLLAVRVTDPVGQTRAAAATLIVTTPPIPPGQLGVTVNNGAQYTRSPDVTLFLNFPATTAQILISNDGGFLAPTILTPKKEIAWKLDSSGPERLPKTVYVRFMLGPIVSETYTDDIILDEIPPTVDEATVEPAATGAVHSAKLRKLALKLKASDSNSGVDAVQVTARKSKPGKFLRYRTKLTVQAATRKLFVRARDRAGNLSRWRKAR